MPRAEEFVIHALHVQSQDECKDNGAIIDSGASHHLTSDRSLFHGVVRACHVPIKGIGGPKGAVVATGVGSGQVTINGCVIGLHTLFYVPLLDRTLLSGSELINDGHKISIDMVRGVNTLVITTSVGGVAHVVSENGLYAIDVDNARESHAVWAIDADDTQHEVAGYVSIGGKHVGNTYVGSTSLGDLLHARCGHVSWATLPHARRMRAVFGARLGKGHCTASCEACARSKIRRSISRSPPARPATRPLERVHFDMSPAIPEVGVGGAKGYLVVVDEKTGFFRQYMLSSKAQVPDFIQAFRMEAEKHFATKMTGLAIPHELAEMRSDGEAVNVQASMREWCTEHGIRHEVSAPYAQEQDGIVERLIQALWQGGEAMRKASGAPAAYWPYSLRAFGHTLLRLAISDSDASPWEQWHDITVPLARRIARFRTFGCKSYVLIPAALRKKLEDKCRVCVFLGYSERSKAYICQDLRTRKIYVSKSVLFDETVFPLRTAVSAGALEADSAGLDSAMVTAWADSIGDDDIDSVVLQPGISVEVHEEGGGVPLSVVLVPDEAVGSSSDTGGDSSDPLVSAPTDSEDSGGLSSSSESVQEEAKHDNIEGLYETCDHGPSGASDDSISPIPSVAGSSSSSADASNTDSDASPLGDVHSGGSDTPGPIRRQARPRRRAERRDRRTVVNGRSRHRQSLSPVSTREHAPTPPRYRTRHSVLKRAMSLHIEQALGHSSAMRAELDLSLGAVDLDGAPSLQTYDFKAGQAQLHAGSRLESETLSQPVMQRLEARIALLALAASAPKKFDEAVRGVNAKSWWSAMDSEYRSMEDFGTWVLVQPPPGAKVHGCRWVFAIKRDAEGVIKRLKARLVARGDTMIQGVDYDESWSPTCRLRSFRYQMAEVSSSTKIMMRATDATNAYLHAEMDTKVYMQQPRGFQRGQHGDVCELLKAVYGCPQSGRLWFKKLTSTIMAAADTLGASVTVDQGKADECLFVLRRGDEWVKSLYHVDDGAHSFNSQALYDEFLAHLQLTLDIKDMPLDHFLGLQVRRGDDGVVHLCQSTYIDTVLERYGLSDATEAWSPEATGTKAKLTPLSAPLSAAEALFMQGVPYGEAVGALHYIARATRPDIAHACTQVARFVKNPSPTHWHALVRVWRYLKRTRAAELSMASGDPTQRVPTWGLGNALDGMCDADWAGEAETRRSHTGWLVRAAGASMAWMSRRQDNITQSSTEAELVAANALGNEVAWWRLLAADFGHDIVGPTTMWCDNSSTVALSKHSGSFQSTKHIELKHLKIREREEAKEVMLKWFDTKSNQSDIMTKNAAVFHFRAQASAMLGCSV